MSVFSEIEKRNLDDELLDEAVQIIWNVHVDRTALIAIIKAARQEIQDERDSYAPDVHPDHDFLENMERILEGES